ncbi:recombinase family protein [Kroppenstedtia pulmonis]|uniref:Recombinase family protein n=2 Tax=Kroppenstedtia pulmonis TaxID=1380685 RepID=A0A7D3XZV2_9BACL|nr:recombinase family protein [Kroppenstedtia pulmonis]QKG83920.1 recombinase family protein [Kroppenstedtia pulmonis]
MTVALYCRVSTDEQVQQGFSIDNQKERLQAFALSQGWTDYRFYIDDGYTGTNMDRPGLKRMIQHAEDGTIRTIVVYRLDRLGRRQKDVLFLLEDVFEKSNVAFKSATEPFDTATPLGKAMIGILAVFAQLERDTIVERTTAGRRQRIRSGKWYGGRVPFGYQWNSTTQTLEVVPEESTLVKEAFSMYLQGHSSSYIADWLTSRSTARFFDHSVIRTMLQRPIYTGHMNNAGKLVEGQHEGIIDGETYERVQQELHKRQTGRPPVGEYLLSGILRCGICGGPVIHVWASGKRYEYYACKAQHVRQRNKGHHCSLGYTRKEKLDSWVAERLKQISLNPEQVEVQLKTLTTMQQEQRDRTAELEQRLENINHRLERWYDAFEQGLLNPAQLKKRIDSLEEERKTVMIRLDELDHTPKEQWAEGVIQTLETIGEAWDSMNFSEQKMVLRAALDHIVLFPDREPKLIWNV